MKYKYVGEDNCFCMELLAYKLVPKKKLLMKGDIIEVPDDNVRIIKSMEVTDHFQLIEDNKDNKKSKKENK